MDSNTRIFQIALSKGGVPKHAVQTAAVTTLGIEGDKHRDMRHHGGPDRALCLYSLEHILALQGEGHPIFPGSTGENILTLGLNFAEIPVGALLKLGEEVRLEITSHAAPCKTIRGSFIDEGFTRISQKLHPGWSRLYARVLREGTIRVGDGIRLIA